MAKAEYVAENVIRFFCPGCREFHAVPVNGKRLRRFNGEYMGPWNFNGDFNLPTITPSLNASWGKQADPNYEEPDGPAPGNGWSGRCHSVITNGLISFCGDSTHPLSGQNNIPLPELP
jgi:hypothetical protein